MALAIKTTATLKITDPIVGIAINQTKITTDNAGDVTFTGTATGGSTVTLVDTATNFVSEGIKVGTIVTRTLGGTSTVVTISTTTNLNDTLNFAALSGGTAFVLGNEYSLSTSWDYNFVAETYELGIAETTWTKVSKGDIGRIRDIYLILTTTAQAENIDILITSTADPNAPSVLPRTFSMRDMFISTTYLDAAQNIWIKNLGQSQATVLSIMSGENV
jgi:hypothetical protein